MAYPTELDDRRQDRLERARKECLQVMRDFIGGGESWDEQFQPLLEAIEEMIEAKCAAAGLRGFE